MKFNLAVTIFALASATFTAAGPIDSKKGAVCKGKKCCTANTGHADLDTYLIGNCEWARRTNKANSTFLPTLAQSQAPPVVWVGCADSRVPESVITNKRPGDIFVTRNIANQVHADDDSANAVIDYGVLHLGASHVVVVGHTNCGGAKAAFAAAHPEAAAPHKRDNTTLPEPADAALNRFLGPLIEIAKTQDSVDALIKANVAANVANVVSSPTIKEAWAAGKKVYVHGWLYDLATGIITDLSLTQGPK